MTTKPRMFSSLPEGPKACVQRLQSLGLALAPPNWPWVGRKGHTNSTNHCTRIPFTDCPKAHRLSKHLCAMDLVISPTTGTTSCSSQRGGVGEGYSSITTSYWRTTPERQQQETPPWTLESKQINFICKVLVLHKLMSSMKNKHALGPILPKNPGYMDTCWAWQITTRERLFDVFTAP